MVGSYEKIDKLFEDNKDKLFTKKEVSEKLNINIGTVNSVFYKYQFKIKLKKFIKRGEGNKRVYYTSNQNFKDDNYTSHPNYEMNLNFR
ncbi:MAG: hypothetical protein KC589_09910 [Nanoarchaeota archaeon]|nr:hypothetical protein [Nanoarchaeota archaeon]